MKFFLTGVVAIGIFSNLFAQRRLSAIPETPLTYWAYEITSTVILSDYTKRSKYLYYGPESESEESLPVNSILQKKYSDLPLYSFFSAKPALVSFLESQTIISRTADYVAYVLIARESSANPFVTYVKDTFFLSGTKIISVNEAIYDTEHNAIASYATYDVFYHSNGKVERIQLQDHYQEWNLNFAGLSVVYNENNTLKTDTTYTYSLDNSDTKIKVSSYQDHVYEDNNEFKIDTTFYHFFGTDYPVNGKFSYEFNEKDEIIKANAWFFLEEGKYTKWFYYDFEQDQSLGILSQSNASEFSIYPNPVQEMIHIPRDYAFQSWSITSISGGHIESGIYTDLNKISVADLEAGMYVLTLQNNDQTWISKFVK